MVAQALGSVLLWAQRHCGRCAGLPTVSSLFGGSCFGVEFDSYSGPRRLGVLAGGEKSTHSLHLLLGPPRQGGLYTGAEFSVSGSRVTADAAVG